MKRNYFLAGAAAFALMAGAVPAKRGIQTVTQPDGTTIEIRAVGDEHMHFLTTADGYLLKKDANGYWNYGRIDVNGRLVSTGIVARGPENRSQTDLTSLQNIKTVNATELMATRRKNAPSRAGMFRSNAQNGMGRFTSDFPREGDVKALVILVEYSDVKFKLSDPKSYFSNLLNQKGFSEYGGTGSATDYFLEMSMGKFRPQFDLYGPVTLPQKRSYYGGNDSQDNDMYPEMMLVHAAQILDPDVDFSQYDMDNDGYVDNVYIFYAGLGEASASWDEDAVWPHSWALSSANKSVKVDGKIIDSYACSNEWEGNRPDGVGTFVHEFSHVMGLPDLYTTDYSDAETLTPGAWSVMDYGPYNNDGRTPPAYSVYERNAMGWIDLKELSEPENVSLGYIAETNEGCIIQTGIDNEFFLLENRQQEGWDTYVPGHGMLIWHIDYNQYVFDSNEVNNSVSHQYVDIVEANNRADNEVASVMAGYPWPGTSNKTEFTSKTTPALKTWSGKSIDVPLTSIAEKNGIISFDVCGGKPLIDTPVNNEPEEIGNGYFIASWQPVDGAVDYLLSVHAVMDSGVSGSVTADMGTSKNKATLPEGWASNTTNTYSSASNFGAAIPSLKMSTDGCWLQTEEFESDVIGISFWAKGQQSEGSTLTIEGLIGNSWVTIEEYTPVKNQDETHEVQEIPAGVKQIKFTYNKVTGNMAIDDICISYGHNDEVLPDYDGISTSGETRMLISKLRDGHHQYRYSVMATDGENLSRASAPTYVYIGTTGIGSAVENSGAAISVNGRDVVVTGVDAIEAEVYDTTGRKVATAPVAEGEAFLTLPSAGIYIVKAGDSAFKTIVK